MKIITLSAQLFETAQAVRLVSQGQSLDQILMNVEADLRPGVQSLSFYVLRHLGHGQALAQKLVKKAPPIQVQALLWTALTLCAAQEEGAQEDSDEQQEDVHHGGAQKPSYRPYVLVSQAVEAAKKHPKTRSFAPLVNGVLRSFLRDKDQLLVAITKDDAKEGAKDGGLAKWNFQPWWIKRVKKDWPDQWQTILGQAQIPAPMTLRVNAQWANTDQALTWLQEHGIEARAVGSYAVELQAPMPVGEIPGFDEGKFSVQAAAAQLAAPLLLDATWVQKRRRELGRPLRVLDACAAPGGKTAHMLEMAASADSIQVVAIDVDASRLEKVRETLGRVIRCMGEKADDGIKLLSHVELRVADATAPDAFAEDAYFDAILLDAPCTAAGIVRRHPDIRWLRRESDVVELAKQQQNLMAAMWQRLNPKGRLLYCTCSVFKAEGEENAQRFLMGHNAVNRLPAPGHILPVDATSQVWGGGSGADEAPCTGTDGFYYALFEK